MIGYFVHHNLKNGQYYLVTIKVFDYKNYDIDNKLYYTNSFEINSIEDIYDISHYIGLFNIINMTDCKFRTSKNVALDELYDKYMNSYIDLEIDLEIAKEINIYTYDGKLVKSYFMNNFKIEGECKEYEDGKLYRITNYINSEIAY